MLKSVKVSECQIKKHSTKIDFLVTHTTLFRKLRSWHLRLGGIQQLRGQEGGEGGPAKIPRLSTRE